MPDPIECAECRVLTDDYVRRSAEHSRAVKVLATRLGVLNKAEYQAIRCFAEEAHLASEQARLALAKHVNEDQC